MACVLITKTQKKFDVVGFNFGMDKKSSMMSCSLELLNADEYQALIPKDVKFIEFDLITRGYTLRFISEDYAPFPQWSMSEFNRVESYSLNARSKTGLLDNRHSDKVSKMWVNTHASVIALELANV